MRFLKLSRFTNGNEKLQEIVNVFNQEEYAIIPNELLNDVCTMLAEAEVYHLIFDRTSDAVTFVLYANMHDYHRGLAKLQERNDLPVVQVDIERMIPHIDFCHPDHTWVELGAGESITPQDIKDAIRDGMQGINQPYDEHKHFVGNREWHIRRVIHLVHNPDDTPILIACREDENGDELENVMVAEGKHRFMAAIVRNRHTINAFVHSPIAIKLLEPNPLYGIANADFDVKHPLTNQKLKVKKGERFQVLELEDIKAKVRFLEGEAEAKGRSYVLDRLMLSLY